MKRIAVYCSSRDGLKPAYVQAATALGEWIGKRGHMLVYGGVQAGLMHDVAAATRNAGGKVLGVVPERFAHRIDGVNDENLFTRDLADRKQVMMEQADAFVVLPGGLGTLDEWISTLSQLVVNGEADARPIVVLNLDGMYDGTIAQLAYTAATPLARGGNLQRSIIATTAAGMIEALENNL